VHETGEVHKLALLLRVDIGNAPTAAARFLRDFVRSSKHNLEGMLMQLRDHTAHFHLATEEAALYQVLAWSHQIILLCMFNRALHAAKGLP
jgi:hypothetical protein